MTIYEVANLFEQKRQEEIDRKWAIVKAHYEKTYKDSRGRYIKFKTRLSDDKINELYRAMEKLGTTEFYQRQKLNKDF